MLILQSRNNRSALSNVSNAQSKTASHWPAPAELRMSSAREAPHPPYANTVTGSTISQDFLRRHAKPQGDLSKLRPKSPVSLRLPTKSGGLHISPGQKVEDTPDPITPVHSRQRRPEIPVEWASKESILCSDDMTNPPFSSDFGISVPRGRCLSDHYINHGIQGIHGIFENRGHRRNRRDLGDRGSHGNHGDCHLSPIPAAINIQGLSPNILGPLDFCIPVVRGYPVDMNQSSDMTHDYTSRHHVQHIDVTSSWSGLQYAHALELHRIHKAFTLALEKILASELWKAYGECNISDRSLGQDPYTRGVVRNISFCGNHLVEEMTRFLCSFPEPEVSDSFGLLRAYLAANDSLFFLQRNSRDTAITVHVCHDYGSRVPCPVIEAAWAPDFIRFKGFNAAPREGEEICIIPQYQSNSAFRPDRFPSNVRYTVDFSNKLVVWLSWDQTIAGFRGFVPTYSRVQGDEGHSEINGYSNLSCRDPSTPIKTLLLDVRATLYDDNGPVAHERILCARLTLEVLPGYAPTTAQSSSRRHLWKSNISNPTSDFRMGTPIFSQARESALGHGHDGYYGHRGHRGHHGHQPNVQSYNNCNDNQHRRNLSAKLKDRDPQLPELAQKHADLAAKYADMSRRHADAEMYVRSLCSSTYIGGGPIHQPRFPMDCAKDLGYVPIACSPNSVQCDISNYSKRPSNSKIDLAAPGILDSSRLKLASDMPITESPSNIRSGNSPSTVRWVASQNFDEKTQAWSRRDTEAKTLKNQIRLKSLDAVDAVDTVDAHQPCHKFTTYGEATTQNFTTPSTSPNTLTISKVERNSERRHANTTNHQAFQLERAKECIRLNSIAASKVRTILEDAGSPAQSRTNSPANTAVFKTPSLTLQSSVPSSDEKAHGLMKNTFNQGAASHSVPRSMLNTTVFPCTNTPLNSIPENSIGIRNVSSCSWQSRDSCSRAASSSIILTAEDPHDILSRSEQARKWAELSSSEDIETQDSDKENEVAIDRNEPRLSDEELKDLEDAMERSLKDLDVDFYNSLIFDSDDSDGNDADADV